LHYEAFFFAVFQLQTSRRTGHRVGLGEVCPPDTVKSVALLKLPAVELIPDLGTYCYHENHGYFRTLHFPGCQIPSSVHHQWEEIKALSKGCLNGLLQLPSLGDAALTRPPASLMFEALSDSIGSGLNVIQVIT